ncbi:hypothetical protein CF065_18845 [Clostridium sporogenes]
MKREKTLKKINELLNRIDKKDFRKLSDEERELRSLLDDCKYLINEPVNNVCGECGEPMVCPKCTPIVEKTNTLIIRYKDVDYNGGYPNALIISPFYVEGSGKNISVATLVGDNFWTSRNNSHGFSFVERGTVKQTAEILANLNSEKWIELFKLPKNRKFAVDDIRIQLINYLENSQKRS